MSLNYAFGFSLFLLILVGLNLYFFYTLNGVGKNTPNFPIPRIKVDFSHNIFDDIHEYLNYLPSQYKARNSKFGSLQRTLINSFNASKNTDFTSVWKETEKWNDEKSLFPHQNTMAGKILHAIQTAPIALVDNAPKGTQLKLLLLLEGKQKLFFKPRRYGLDHVINGKVYGGFDRHNSEVFAYYLAIILNMRWIAPSAIRKIHLNKDILPVATVGLKRSMIKNESGLLCIYGKCFYCRRNETVCPDQSGAIEGAAILYFDKQFKVFKSPWRRSYTTRNMEWQNDKDFCKKVKGLLSTKRILNLVDVAIFDFLIQNGDRHHYEVYKDQIVLLDNGKGLGNPAVDELDILAPLYQCCMIALSTWQSLEMVSGGSLTETIKQLSAFHGHVLAREDHFKAVERRLLKVYATVQYCIGKHGRAKNYRLDFTSYSNIWRGATETIVPTANAQVWGVIWRVREDDMRTLDEQHKIQTNLYSVNDMDILTAHMGDISCRVYIQTDNPLPRGDNDAVPMEKWPSWSYKEVIIIGALENHLPDHYILYLEGIKDNGDRGFFCADSLLTRDGADAPCVCDLLNRLRNARS